jgi:hypothetical protein
VFEERIGSVSVVKPVAAAVDVEGSVVVMPGTLYSGLQRQGEEGLGGGVGETSSSLYPGSDAGEASGKGVKVGIGAGVGMTMPSGVGIGIAVGVDMNMLSGFGIGVGDGIPMILGMGIGSGGSSPWWETSAAAAGCSSRNSAAAAAANARSGGIARLVGALEYG